MAIWGLLLAHALQEPQRHLSLMWPGRGSSHSACILGKQMWFPVCCLEFLEPECLFYVIYSKNSSVDFRTLQPPNYNLLKYWIFYPVDKMWITQDITGTES